ncbi:glycosyltransferase [Flavobacterium sp. ZB4P23]|uniref:glycosyltransferase family 2 protein n=1 Tax=unclassified Flavobacterium TaxID=196869 RepID=UPI000F83D661|nr:MULTISPECIES: glycosyltransferase [unclassified Flavobacterium]RTY83277.1 glycosyltransferase [Flavobacterium sp. ZB4P23]RTY93152.1 glycosyltransferase [Flavobacterium sp. RSP46]
MKINLISIVLPVYNGEKYLASSIESCLNQTYQNIELIIVNDCSTDGTSGIINRFAEKDKRVRIINNTINIKLPASLNVGHVVAKGDFITWTSDDNYYEANAIEELLKSLLEKQVDIVYSDVLLIDYEAIKVREVNFLNFENIIFGNFVGSCFLYKKEVFERNNGYNEELFLIEDYDFWLRAIIHSKYSHLNKTLYNYRKHENSLTNQIYINDEKEKIFLQNIKKMYDNFCFLIMDRQNTILSEFCTNVMTHQKIEFNWIIKNDLVLKMFKKQLLLNNNFINKILLERVFLNKTIQIMINQKDSQIYLIKSLYIIKKYLFFLDKNSIKTLIKYSFFNTHK